MAKKIRLFSVVMAVIVLFTSCKGPILDVGNLLTPPVFFSEQNKIIDALKSSVGNEIELEYPSGGDYRSAFILYDIDKDGSNEAIVFYRLVKPDMLQNMVHINLLDTKKGVRYYRRGNLNRQGGGRHLFKKKRNLNWLEPNS